MLGLLIGSSFACTIWGLQPHLAKRFMTVKGGTSSEVFMFSASMMFFIWMILLMLVSKGKTPGGRWGEIKTFFSKVNWPLFALWALAGNVIATIVFYNLLKNNDTYLVVALTSITPLFSAAFGYFLFGDKFGWKQIVGMVLIVSGIVVLLNRK